MGTAVLSVPLILDRLGTAGYGAWTLATTLLIYASIAETGVGPALQRFVAAADGIGDRAQIARLLTSATLLYMIVGCAAIGSLWVLGPTVAAIFDLPAELQAESVDAYRHLGFPIALVLLATGVGNVLQGLGRFELLTLSAALGGGTYLVAIVLLVEPGDLSALVLAASCQHAVVFSVRLLGVTPIWRGAMPRLLAGPEARRVIGFSLRLQATSLSELVNWQSDKLIMGFVAGPTTLGYLGIGQQVADSGRLLSGGALSPINAALASRAGAGDHEGVLALYLRLHRLWVLTIFGGAVVGAAATGPLIDAWLAQDVGDAPLFASLLILGSACGLSTGTGIAYLRAIGQPGLEARYSTSILAVNAVLTIGFAVLFGPVGIVVGTLCAYASGAAFFFSRLRRRVPVSPVGGGSEGLRVLVLAALAASGAYGGGHVLASGIASGFALPPVVVVTLLAIGIYICAVLRIRPTPAGVRAWGSHALR